MILVYACGGGLGHLTRARAALRALGREEEAVLLTASPHAADSRVTGSLPVIAVPEKLAGDPESLRRFIREVIARERPAEILIDAFPAGLVGELACLDEFDLRVSLIARDLKWEAYRSVAREAPRIETALAVEPLHEEYDRFLRAHAGLLRELRLDPLPSGRRLDAGGAWLVVHSGPDGETDQLVAFARETARLEGERPEIIVITPGFRRFTSEDVRRIDEYPASTYYESAGRIFTACGFNAFLETAPYPDKHFFLPFPRRFDDQFRRAARRRENRGTAWAV